MKRWFFYLTAFLISFFVMVMYEGAYIEGIFAVVVFLPIICSLLKYMPRAFLVIDWKLETEFDKDNKKIHVFAVIKNNCPLPIGRIEAVFEAIDSAGGSQSFTMVTNIPAFSHRKCRMELTPNYSGRVLLRLKKVRIWDMLGLTATRCKCEAGKIYVKIYPGMEKIETLVMENPKMDVEEGENYSDSKRGSDRAQIFDVSVYQMGDSVRDIHWKLSSKAEELMVKRFSQPVESDVNIFVDFGISEGGRATLKGTDDYFKCVYTLVEELEKNNDKVNIFSYSKEEDDFKPISKGDIVLCRPMQKDNLDRICSLFVQRKVSGAGMLISSRLNRSNIDMYQGLEPYYIDWEDLKKSREDEYSELYIQDISVIGVDVEAEDKHKKPALNYNGDLYINRSRERLSVFSYIIRLMLIYLGAFIPVAAVLDAIVINDKPIMPGLYAAAALILMFGLSFVRNTAIKLAAAVTTLAAAIAFGGFGNIIEGGEGIISSLGHSMQREPLGITDNNALQITALLSLLAFIYVLILFIFTWDSPVIFIHILITMPLMSVSMVYGRVPSGIHTILYACYVAGLTVYYINYRHIVRNEKNVLKKGFYESTINISSILCVIAMFITAFIMLADLAKGYTRNEKLREIKLNVNSFMEDFKISKIFKGEEIAGGGVNGGKLGQVDRIEYDYRDVLRVTIEGDVILPLYIKSYVGTDYTGNSWEVIRNQKSDIIMNNTYGLSYMDISNIPYELLKLDYERMLDITDEPVNAGRVGIEKLEDDDVNPYGLYGGESIVRFVRDGVMYDTKTKNFLINTYTVKNPCKIKRAASEFYVSWNEELYSNAVKLVYGINRPLKDSEERLKNEMPWSYNLRGVNINLREGVEKNGYEAYIGAVRQYISDNYSYTLSPGRLEEGRDFLDVFMDSRQGYCTHFATLATEMFRLYGIPARYVEGYYVDISQSDYEKYMSSKSITLIISDNAAHAWTEIYIDGYGWMPVEATPGYQGPGYEPDSESTSLTETSKQPTTSMRPSESITESSAAAGQQSTSDSDKETSYSNEPEINDKDKHGIGGAELLAISFAAASVLFLGIAVLRRFIITGRKRDLVKGRNYERAAIIMDRELSTLMAMAEPHSDYKPNAGRGEQAQELLSYVKNISLKNPKRKAEEITEDRLLRMYYLMDKAMYSGGKLNEEEMQEAIAAFGTVVQRIYRFQPASHKFYIKYIKCLYLK